MANILLFVYLFSIKYSAAAWKSSKTFCLFSKRPASCHFSPYSPPPRRFATATTPFKCFIKTNLNVLYTGCKLTLNPPYP
uniref:Putative secreted protein n=1 Tax=Panstrongylus lignarius TaxID=156445 RepID=A0A224XZV3_9HEMI